MTVTVVVGWDRDFRVFSKRWGTSILYNHFHQCSCSPILAFTWEEPSISSPPNGWWRYSRGLGVASANALDVHGHCVPLKNVFKIPQGFTAFICPSFWISPWCGWAQGRINSYRFTEFSGCHRSTFDPVEPLLDQQETAVPVFRFIQGLERVWLTPLQLPWTTIKTGH